MLIKVALLFLIGMLVLAMFGKLRLPRLPRSGKHKNVEQARKCPDCGSYIIGNGPCPCRDRKS